MGLEKLSDEPIFRYHVLMMRIHRFALRSRREPMNHARPFSAHRCRVNINTPFLLATTMSGSLSPVTSVTTNCVPMPESSSI